jgi:hypothetical protein
MIFQILCLNVQTPNGGYQLSNVKSATEDDFGFVKYVFDFNKSTNPPNGVISWKLFQKALNNITRSLNVFQRNGFYYDFNQFSNDVGIFLDKNMTQLEASSNRLPSMYDNLEISAVSLSGDYNDLNDGSCIVEYFRQRRWFTESISKLFGNEWICLFECFKFRMW